MHQGLRRNNIFIFVLPIEYIIQLKMQITTNDETFRVQYVNLTDDEALTFRLLTACNHSIVLDNYGAAAAMINNGEATFPIARDEFFIFKEHFGNWYDVSTDDVA